MSTIILQQRGHESGALTTRDPEPDRRVKGWNADMIASGCTTGFNRQCFSVARRLKDLHPGIPIIAGGAHATFLPEHFDRNPCIDCMIIDEADTAVTRMVEALEGSRPFSEVGNLILRDSGGTVWNARPRGGLRHDPVPEKGHPRLKRSGIKGRAGSPARPPC